uniref:Si:ch73-238c9.1 n=1 Tax=Seriola dumerili TaxID=41447 RepID=A0A3B4VER5_SERDU
MNIGSKNKKRVVLPSRPDPPTVDQILEDINRAAPNDPVFSILEQTGQGESTQICRVRGERGGPDLPPAPTVWFTVCLSCPCSDSSRSSDSDVDLKFQQCRQYLDLNERLQESRSRLLRQREELRAAGEQLDRDVAKCLSPRANRPWAEFLPSGRLT